MSGQGVAVQSEYAPASAPVSRLAALFDDGTLRVFDAPPSDRPVGVVAAEGLVEGRPVVAYAQDASMAGGSVGTAEAEVVVRALRLARHQGYPVVAFLESGGARLQEGAAALGGFARIFYENVQLSGRAPQISVITGLSAGGGCYSPALTDFIVMTRQAAMFLTGPKVVREAVGEEISVEALGGPGVHERNGVCQFVVDDDEAAGATVRELLGHLPGPDGSGADAPPTAAPGDPGQHVPAVGRQVYDVRKVARDLLDGGRFLEVSDRWARNMVCGFGRIEGQPVGVIANQPRHLGGVIDVPGAEKGARFVNTCQRFGIPLVVLVDTPGFMPGSSQESAGIIRHGASLVRAFAAATVPRFTVVVRKAYGGAYITMNSKDLGADLAFAWEGAEIGIMGPAAAVTILNRRQIAAANDPEAAAAEYAAQYAARHISADRALELGLLDDVIAPAETRERLAEALTGALAGAR